MQTSDKRLGFIGLGVMGKPMCLNLIRAGNSLMVYDINSEAVEELVQAGAKAGTSPSAIGSECNVIFTMLPDSPHVEGIIK